MPTKVYDRTIEVLETSLEKAKAGDIERKEGLARLHRFVLKVERELQPHADFERLLEHERRISHEHGGRSVFGFEPKRPGASQMTLFER